jgi:hypothetical protein
MMATVTIQKRTRKKGVRYLVSYKVPMNGKKKYYKTFGKYREAQQAANDLRSMLDSGNLPDPKRTKLNALSFNQVAIVYLGAEHGAAKQEILDLEWAKIDFEFKDAKEMIGHSDITMTDRYTHLTTQRHLPNQRHLSEHYTGVDIG